MGETAMVEVDASGMPKAVGGGDHGDNGARGSKIADMLVAVQGAILAGDGEVEKESYFDAIKNLVMSDIMPDLRAVRDARQEQINDAIDAIKATTSNYTIVTGKRYIANSSLAQLAHVIAAPDNTEFSCAADVQ